MKKKAFIALLPATLLTLSAVLFAYGRAIVSISPSAVIRPLAILLAIVFLLAWPINKLTNNWHTTSLLLTIFVVGFYFTESLFYPILIVGVLAYATQKVITHLLKRKSNPEQTTKLFCFVSLIILLSILLQFIAPSREVDWVKYENSLSNTQNNLPTDATQPTKIPDIYFIVLDAYGREDILQRYYDYDNSEFVSFLNEKGFIVSPTAHSNYPYTALSVASTLNMDYIQNIAAGAEESHFWWLMQPYIYESRTRLILEKFGYQTISIETGWDITNNTSTDRYFSPNRFQMSEFEGYFYSTIPLRVFKPAINHLFPSTDYDTHRELILYNFETLSTIPKIPGPKFVFAHIIAPHPPFVFDRNGNDATPKYGFTYADGNDYLGTKAEYKAGYIEQLQFVNAMLKKTVETILAQSETPPIIILQGDHGPRMMTDYRSSINICPNERFSIFAAYYLPGLDHNPFPKDFSSVNIFRIVFNEYFGTEMGLLENEAYLPNDKIYIYRTESIKPMLEDVCSPKP